MNKKEKDLRKRVKFNRNMMVNIFNELIQTAENSLLIEFRDLLDNEIARSDCAIKEGFEVKE